MATTRLMGWAAVAFLMLSGCSGEGGQSGASPEPSGGRTERPPTAQPSPRTAQPSPTTGQPSPSEPDAPALPIPTRPVKPTAGPSGTVTLTGTVQPGVEPNCFLLHGYLLVGGPRDLLAAGGVVTIVGHVEPNMMTTCQQGIPFVVQTARRG